MPESNEATSWAEYVSELLKVNGWTEAYLGELVGVHHTTVSKWRNGRSTPSGSAAKALEDLGNPD